jgi:hypothetical protein
MQTGGSGKAQLKLLAVRAQVRFLLMLRLLLNFSWTTLPVCGHAQQQH